MRCNPRHAWGSAGGGMTESWRTWSCPNHRQCWSLWKCLGTRKARTFWTRALSWFDFGLQAAALIDRLLALAKRLSLRPVGIQETRSIPLKQFSYPELEAVRMFSELWMRERYGRKYRIPTAQHRKIELNTHRASRKISETTSYHRILFDRAFPTHTRLQQSRCRWEARLSVVCCSWGSVQVLAFQNHPSSSSYLLDASIWSASKRRPW